MRFTRWRRRPQLTGELGRLLDAYPGPGSSLGFSVDGADCTWLEGSCCAPGPRPRTRFVVDRVVADAELGGLDREQLGTALARIDELAHRAALERAAGRPPREPSAAERARVAARQVWPSLRVRRAPGRGQWWWEVLAPDGRTLAPLPPYEGPAVLPSQPAAFEVGLANLAVCTAAWALDVHGAELPPDFVRVVPH